MLQLLGFEHTLDTKTKLQETKFHTLRQKLSLVMGNTARFIGFYNFSLKSFFKSLLSKYNTPLSNITGEYINSN